MPTRERMMSVVTEDEERKSTKFARTVFAVAALYGVLILVPGYFREVNFGNISRRPLALPEIYYGFYGVALAWQVAYFLISKDPVRYRPLMLVAMFAKFTFLGACLVLFLLGRLAPGGTLYGSLADGILIIFFLAAYLRTPAGWLDVRNT
jgi:hypothetical protein